VQGWRRPASASCHARLLQSRDLLGEGKLVRVLPGWTPEARHGYAVRPQRRYLPARVRVLLAHLAECAAATPSLQDTT
jgi:LysR family transcriptional regulator AphB